MTRDYKKTKMGHLPGSLPKSVLIEMLEKGKTPHARVYQKLRKQKAKSRKSK